MKEWIWNNLSNINATINIAVRIIGIISFLCGLGAGFLRLKLKRNQYKYLNLTCCASTIILRLD